MEQVCNCQWWPDSIGRLRINWVKPGLLSIQLTTTVLHVHWWSWRCEKVQGNRFSNISSRFPRSKDSILSTQLLFFIEIFFSFQCSSYYNNYCPSFEREPDIIEGSYFLLFYPQLSFLHATPSAWLCTLPCALACSPFHSRRHYQVSQGIYSYLAFI